MEKQIYMEEWKSIPDYEEYQVSTLGRVKRLAYYKNVCGGSKQYCEERILKPQKRKRGYQAVMLSKNSKAKSFLVHRLVAMVFIPNPDNLPQVNHKDENTSNNCVDNLEWCNQCYNSTYGTSKYRISAKLKNGILSKPIMEEGVYAYNEINCYHRDFADKVQIRLGGDYKIEVEEGKTYIVRKKPQYPMSYLDCCRIIVAKHDRHYYYTKKDKEQDYPNEIRILDQLDHLRMLIICRDAYWKIAGEQMGWGKPWEPDWSNDLSKYYISFYNNKVDKGVISYSNKILAFPTEEMRDAFYENFKELIEQCKELL